MSQGGTGEQEVQPGDTQNEAGAYAFSASKSVVQTLAKRGVGSVVQALVTLFRSPQGRPDPG
jgi:hypothetical protein